MSQDPEVWVSDPNEPAEWDQDEDLAPEEIEQRDSYHAGGLFVPGHVYAPGEQVSYARTVFPPPRWRFLLRWWWRQAFRKDTPVHVVETWKATP